MAKDLLSIWNRNIVTQLILICILESISLILETHLKCEKAYPHSCSCLPFGHRIGLPSQFLRFYQNKSTNWIQISAYYLSCSSPMNDWKLMPHLFVFTANWELGHPRGKCRCGCAYFVMVYSAFAGEIWKRILHGN